MEILISRHIWNEIIFSIARIPSIGLIHVWNLHLFVFCISFDYCNFFSPRATQHKRFTSFILAILTFNSIMPSSTFHWFLLRLRFLHLMKNWREIEKACKIYHFFSFKFRNLSTSVHKKLITNWFNYYVECQKERF